MSLNSTDTKQIRKFGLIALILFGSLFTTGICLKKSLSIYFFGSLSVLGIGFVLFPDQLKPVFVSWMKIAHYIGKIITTLVLALAYYLVITPTALIKRMFSGTPLPVKPDKNVSSYWVPREEGAQPKERFSKRF